MKTKPVLLAIAILVAASSTAQITWERIFQTGSVKTIEETVSGNFITTLDSVFLLDAYGNTIWKIHPPVAGYLSQTTYSSAPDKTGGYIIGGYAVNPSFDTYNFSMQLNANGNEITHTTYQMGNSGSIGVTAVMSTADSAYIACSAIGMGAGSVDTYVNKRNQNFTTQWSTLFSSGSVRQDALMEDQSQRIIAGTYNATGASMPKFQRFGITGAPAGTYVVPDTFAGGSSCYSSPSCTMCTDGNYFISANHSPDNGSGVFPYIAKLNTSLGSIWSKAISWPNQPYVNGLAPASGNGLIAMINYQNSIYLLRMNQNGDSLWTKVYSGSGTAGGNMIRQCADGGYIICGSTNGNEYILKLDSLCRLLPSVEITQTPALICPGDSAVLTAAAGYSYEWSNGSSAQSITVSAGSYWVKVKNTAGTDSATSNSINVNYYLLNTTISGSQFICFGDSVILSGPAGQSYQWFPNADTTQQIIVSVAGNVWLHYIDTNNCFVITDTIQTTMLTQLNT
ncbi:MAG: hypothetical protein IAF38_03160, partial [Bacteroidia bacterium]|nr:hypothetical protein [Bacteroidia bacterium]